MAEVVAAVSGAAYTILLVDDEQSIVAALRRTLRGRGYRIVSSTDPHRALEMLATEPIDLVISDIDMPEMSGVELVARVRKTYPEVVRILLTGRGTLEGALRAINDGEVHRFLTKPWSDDELRATVAQALERLEELRRAQQADSATTRRRALLAELEREHPGIGEVLRDADGVYVINERKVEAIRLVVGADLAKLLE
jgi:DNA-binding NtrC family response regulator